MSYLGHNSTNVNVENGQKHKNEIRDKKQNEQRKRSVSCYFHSSSGGIQTGSEGDREASKDVHSESGVKKPQIKLKQFRERYREVAEVRGNDRAIRINLYVNYMQMSTLKRSKCIVKG
jgi:hypothetical protein